ncbi:nucleotidyltransferase domain-containing protein [Actinoplanes sp. NBRC 103695]|uniref:nucleotidyltransferase domain-containing protein n=1 Tax=Actinoplanes sp. NBRC 103695 TaxID=3032202 RepID=UPI0025572C40|nr:nucleotidyltransferase domain-containing protein [Actinoplanes sp. NBRC 103695]
MRPSERWRELLDERVAEAARLLGSAGGVHGLIVGGSVGRGEPWPMSDIDLLPIYLRSRDDDAQLEARRAELVDWWTGSGRAQALDVGKLAFTVGEVRDAMRRTPEQVVGLLGDQRWFHGLDKAYGGRAADLGDELTSGFVAWINVVRFHPAIVAARRETWRTTAAEAVATAATAEPAQATYLVREAARALRMDLLESWGERLGSMGREWTRFERMARRHGQQEAARRLAVLAGADVETASRRAEVAPVWLRERIDLCLRARLAVGEEVTAAENARDQLVAYTLHVVRKRPDLDGPWTGSPEPRLDRFLTELGR